MKRFIQLLLCAMVIFGAAAQDRLYINDFSIEAGETKLVEIQLDNTVAYTALQADIYLPEGLSIEQEDGEYLFDLTDRKARNHTISSSDLASGAIRILIASQTLKTFSGNSGALVTFNIIADASYSGAKVIELKNVVATEPDQTEHQLPNTTCTVTGSGGPTTILASSISLNQTSTVLEQGETLQLVATVMPQDATDKSVTWSTSDAVVATVDANGLVTPVAPGTATITATTNDGSNLSASCTLTVNQPIVLASSIALNQTAAELNEGETLQLAATVLPENATVKAVTWSSSDEAVATVNVDGLVTAVAPGTATITATTNDGSNLSANCVVNVPQPTVIQDVIELNEKAFRLQLTQTRQVAVVTEGVGNVTWSSSDATIASVDANGVVTAHKNGIAIITATATNGATTWCSVYSYLLGDVNEDNMVDVSDVNKVVNKILGKE